MCTSELLSKSPTHSVSTLETEIDTQEECLSLFFPPLVGSKFQEYVSGNASDFMALAGIGVMRNRAHQQDLFVKALSETLLRPPHIIAKQAHDGSCPMVNSGTVRLPTGAERGQFVSVELGGSTIRVSIVELHGNSTFLVPHHSECHIPQSVKDLSGEAFFSHLAHFTVAQCKAAKVESSALTPLRMGLTWSFPLEQHSRTQGTIMAMGKGYNVCKEIIGWEVNEAFSTAFEAIGAHIEIKALLNDTVSSLVAYKYNYPSPNTTLSYIVGTGVNAAIMLPSPTDPSILTLYNTELSFFGDHLPQTRWDVAVDAGNERPGYQPLEFLTGGRYLGEVFRMVILDLACEGFVLSGNPNWEAILSLPYSIDTKSLSETERLAMDPTVCPADYQRVLWGESLKGTLLKEDIHIILGVTRMLSHRTLVLSSVAITALAKFVAIEFARLGRVITLEVEVAGSGSVLQHYHGFKESLLHNLHVFPSTQSHAYSLNTSANTDSTVGNAVACCL